MLLLFNAPQHRIERPIIVAPSTKNYREKIISGYEGRTPPTLSLFMRPSMDFMQRSVSLTWMRHLPSGNRLPIGYSTLDFKLDSFSGFTFAIASLLAETIARDDHSDIPRATTNPCACGIQQSTVGGVASDVRMTSRTAVHIIIHVRIHVRIHVHNQYKLP